MVAESRFFSLSSNVRNSHSFLDQLWKTIPSVSNSKPFRQWKLCIGAVHAYVSTLCIEQFLMVHRTSDNWLLTTLFSVFPIIHIIEYTGPTDLLTYQSRMHYTQCSRMNSIQTDLSAEFFFNNSSLTIESRDGRECLELLKFWVNFIQFFRGFFFLFLVDSPKKTEETI